MMMKKLTNIFLALLLIQSLFGVEAKAQEHANGNAADVVILVDFSGSITDDPRYPEAEKKALQNLVNVSWPAGSNIAILAFGAADSRNGGKPSTFPMCKDQNEVLLSASTIDTWIDSCIKTIGTTPVGPMTDHNKAIKKAVEILSSSNSVNSSKFVLLMTDGKLDVDNLNPVNPDYQGTGEEKDEQAINELFLEVLPEARSKGIQIWPVGFGDVNRIELNGYAPEGGQPGPDSCQREIPRAVIAEPEDLPYEINKIIRQVTCLGEYKQGDNVDLPLPGFADSATVNVKHEEGDEFKILGPNGEEISGGGQGTESTVDIPNPSGGNWQVVSDSPVTVGYWWESSFEPVITCPIEGSNEVVVSVIPSNNGSDSTANSPVFSVEVIINGQKQVVDLELGETQLLYLEEGQNSIVADASVQSLDQPGILSFISTEEDCAYSIAIETTIPEVIEDEEEVVVDLTIDCELTPDIDECKNDLDIPWWLLLLLALTILLILWYLWSKRYLRTGTFVISNSSGEQGRIRVLKKSTSLAFNVNEDAEQGSQVTKSSPEVYGTYEVTKGKKGSDFKITGPTGSGNASERVLVIGDKISLEDGYQVEFEDGFNRKPVVIDADNPFDSDNLSDNFSNPSVDLEEESDDDSPFS